MTTPPNRAMGMLLVFLGGAIGTLLRASIGFVTPSNAAPWITLGINVIGAFTLALLATLFSNRHEHLRLLLCTGLCGGFTTYSAFAVHVAQGLMFDTSGIFPAIALAFATLAAGLAAALGGYLLGMRLISEPER